MYRLVAYSENGSYAGVLSDAKEVSASWKTGATPTLSFSLPAKGALHELTDSGQFQVALEYLNKYGVWVEAANCRFFVCSRSWDASLNGWDDQKINALALSQRLAEAVLGRSVVPALVPAKGAKTSSSQGASFTSSGVSGATLVYSPLPVIQFPLDASKNWQDFLQSTSGDFDGEEANKNGYGLQAVKNRFNKTSPSDAGALNARKQLLEKQEQYIKALGLSASEKESSPLYKDHRAYIQAVAKANAELQKPEPKPAGELVEDYTTWQYSAAYAGDIFSQIWQEAYKRGALVGLIMQLESKGLKLSIKFSADETLKSALDKLVNAGAISARWEGNTLILSDPVSAYEGKTITGTWPLNDTSSGKESESWQNAASKVLVIGDDGAFYWTGSGTGSEKVVKAKGVKNANHAAIAAAPYLYNGAKTTIKREFKGEARYMPLRDFNLFDVFLVAPHPAPIFVSEIHLGFDAHKLSGELTFGSPQDTILEQLTARANALSGGATITQQGAPEHKKDEPVPPGKVTGLVARADTVINEDGSSLFLVYSQWTSTPNANRYEAAIKEASGDWRPISTTDTTSITLQALNTGAHKVRVRGVSDQAGAGPWSDEVTVTVKGDDTVPGKPSQPRISEFFRTITVYWDGKADGGKPIDADVSECLVFIGKTAEISEANQVGRVGIESHFTTKLLERDTIYHVWLKAIDAAGNIGEPSNRSTIQTSPVKDAEAFFQTGAIKAGIIEANAIKALQLDADAITSKHTITGAKIQTDSRAARGVKIDSFGMRMYTPSGTEVFNFDSNTGSLRVDGDITAKRVYATDGAYAVWADAQRIGFSYNNTLESWIDRNGLHGRLSGSLNGSMRDGNSEFNSRGMKVNGIGTSEMGILYASNRMEAPKFVAHSLGIGTGSPGSITTVCALDNYAGSFRSWSSFRCEQNIWAAGSITGASHPTHSLRELKTDVEPVRDLTALLDVEPVAYRYKPDADKVLPHPWLDLKPVKMAGWIAEELEEAGLGLFCAYDMNAKGERTLKGVEYDRLSVGLWQIARKQRDQIEDLTKRIEKLEQLIENKEETK